MRLVLSFVAALTAASDAPPSDRGVGDLYDRVLAYRRERLEVQPLPRSRWVTPLVLAPQAYDLDVNPGWNEALPRLMPMPADPEGNWGVVRGNLQVLDDLDLAHILGDEVLAKRIEDARFWPRVAWSTGFGVAGAAALGTGAYYTWGADGGNTAHAVGISLLTVGVASGILAILYPAYAPHVLTPHDAAERCDAYNAELRQRLMVQPEDLQRF